MIIVPVEDDYFSTSFKMCNFKVGTQTFGVFIDKENQVVKSIGLRNDDRWYEEE